MDKSIIVSLIRGGVDASVGGQLWYDLGAGRGSFTMPLAELLNSDSKIYAVDKDDHALKSIRQVDHGAKISIVAADFTDAGFSIDRSDGILMANALHYVEDQSGFLFMLRDRSLLPRGRLIIVEYDRRAPNQWVPFPIGFHQLKEISLSVGFSSVEKLGEAPSAYDNVLMYGAVIRK